MKLFKHQQKALEQTANHNRVGYYLDMGLGKTFVGSEKMVQLGKRVNLVICQKSKIDDWVEHLKNNYVHIVRDLTNKKDFEKFIFESSRTDLTAFVVGVINYELVWRRKELLQLHDFTLMLDESSQIQNESAKKSKFILKMQPENVILLSGTPTSGKYENLWSQCKLLGWNISKKAYWNTYVETEWLDSNGFGKLEIVTGYKNVERLKRKLAEHGTIFMKTSEAFELPQQVDTTLSIDCSKEYRSFMKNSMITVNDKELIGDNTLTKMLYARQLCGQYSKAKLEAFRDLLESTNDRLIVFYNFTRELEILADMASELDKPISVVNGERKSLQAYENFDNSVTFIQYQSGSMGLNLQKANKTVYYTLPLSCELFEQSKKRTHRIGQNKSCFYWYLLCRGSIEEKILKTLEMRMDYNEELFRQEG